MGLNGQKFNLAYYVYCCSFTSFFFVQKVLRNSLSFVFKAEDLQAQMDFKDISQGYQEPLPKL